MQSYLLASSKTGNFMDVCWTWSKPHKIFETYLIQKGIGRGIKSLLALSANYRNRDACCKGQSRGQETTPNKRFCQFFKTICPATAQLWRKFFEYYYHRLYLSVNDIMDGTVDESPGILHLLSYINSIVNNKYLIRMDLDDLYWPGFTWLFGLSNSQWFHLLCQLPPPAHVVDFPPPSCLVFLFPPPFPGALFLEIFTIQVGRAP